jgi:hypothetical protein
MTLQALSTGALGLLRKTLHPQNARELTAGCDLMIVKRTAMAVPRCKLFRPRQHLLGMTARQLLVPVDAMPHCHDPVRDQQSRGISGGLGGHTVFFGERHRRVVVRTHHPLEPQPPVCSATVHVRAKPLANLQHFLERLSHRGA